MKAAISRKERYLKKEEYLDQAEDEFLFTEASDFYFEIRKRPGSSDFYAQLETELQSQNLFKVVEYREVKEGYARISRPSRLHLNQEQLLRVKPELKSLKENINLWHHLYGFISVKEFIKKNKEECLKKIEIVEPCLDVFQFLINNFEKNKGLLARQIPHGYSTKLIGKEKILLKVFQFWQISVSGKGDSLISWKDFFRYFQLLKTPPEFRIYAPQVVMQNKELIDFQGIVNNENISEYRWPDLKGSLIIENWESFYALVSMKLPCLLIWGGGWKASLLKSILEKIPKPLFYWGDMDKEGYEIFGFLQNISNSKITALFMNEESFNLNSHLKQKKEIYFGPFKDLHNLQSIYEFVCKNGYQIEQEQIEIKEAELRKYWLGQL